MSNGIASGLCLNNTSNDAAAPSLDDSLLARTVVAADVTTSRSRSVEVAVAIVCQGMLSLVLCPKLLVQSAEMKCAVHSLASIYKLVMHLKRILTSMVCNFQGWDMLLNCWFSFNSIFLGACH